MENNINSFVRCSSSIKKFNVTITETLKLTVEVKAENHQEAERIVSNQWKNCNYILSGDNFTVVEFVANLLEDEEVN